MTERCPALLPMVLWLSGLLVMTAAQEYALDRQSTCGQTLTVYDRELTLVARSNVAPANPPLECIVYLQSGYQAADGRSRLQIIVEQLQIGDCQVKLALFNGRGASGNYLRLLGCSSSSTDIIYTKGRQATLRFSRPLHLYQTGYEVTLTVKAYEDGDTIGTEVGVDTLSVGAIIGIVVGVLIVIAVAILLGWCCCTGYIHNFLRGGSGSGKGGRKGGKPISTTHTTAAPPYTGGSIDSNLEKLSYPSNIHMKQNFPWEEPSVWAGSGQDGSRNFRRGVPRKATARGYVNSQVDTSPRRSDREGITGRDPSSGNVRDSHLYEPYDTDLPPPPSPRFRKRREEEAAGGRSRGSRRQRDWGEGEEEGEQGGEMEEGKEDPQCATSEGEEGATTPTTLRREGSEVDVDTIISPMHINAAVRASVPDLNEEPPPSPSPHSRHSPHSGKRHGAGRDPDPMGLPPEAFDPVFTTPTSQEQYPGEWRPQRMPFMPYGMFPVVPGQQTYAYAYQTAGSQPGQQGAYFVHSVPTAQGDMTRTTFAMHTQRTPRAQGKEGPPGSPGFSSTPEGHPFPTPVALTTPDHGHRSMAMKSFADPRSDLQTTQVMWTDSVPDPSDPKPEDSSQVTRRTTTRITTRSGHGDLPQQTSTLLDEPDPNPAFLAPSHPASLPPAASTPAASNIHYYTGQRSAPFVAHDVVHEGPSRNRAIRDTVRLGDSDV
ncbi:uncharacterized protein LOC143300067 [Babylonia areolata]|uniref:uncharacterized protein LOC143300067 n=1 Tax=Babylonia areolata TaxID=304850 RepID=UPI003FD69131